MTQALKQINLFTYHDLPYKDSGQNNTIIRSPLFYVGDKYKLMPQLKKLFPKMINTYIEPFCGGGSSFLNINAKSYKLNDIDSNLIALHRFLAQHSKDTQGFFDKIFDLIESYNLSCSFLNNTPDKALKARYKKTYFAEFNKDSYKQLRQDFNTNKNDFLRLYVLLIYGFNRVLRFNSKAEFNLPVGNVDFNANVYQSLQDYFHFMENKNIDFFNIHFIDFIESLECEKGDFIYFDPPYLISGSEYNKLWNETLESKLYTLLKKLDSKGVQWGLSNLLTHKGKTNTILQAFMQDFHSHTIQSNYISFNDNSIKKDSKEVYVSNVKS